MNVEKRYVTFKVDGMPQSQGSKSARVVNGRAIVTEGFGDGPRKRKAWREAVAESARAWLAKNGRPGPIDGPVAIALSFRLPRPKSASKRVIYPSTKPDCSKLARSVEDSLSKVIYTDDARIVDLIVRKRFAVNEPPGVTIEVREL